MRNSSTSSSGYGAPISLELAPRRLRWLQHGLMLALGVVGAWVWFGISGAVPFALWWLQCCRPRRHLVVFSEGDVRLVRLSPLRIYVELTGRRRFEIFRDELPAEAFTALRRRLKAAASAGDGLEHVEPI